MQSPAQIDLYADRWVAFNRSIVLVGVDLTGATFAAHIRLTFDTAGTALITLATAALPSEGLRLVYGGTDTVENHIAAGRLDELPTTGFELTDTMVLSVIGIRINETSMEDVAKIPFPAERGDNTELAWDLHVTPSGGLKDVYARGLFIVRPGATQ